MLWIDGKQGWRWPLGLAEVFVWIEDPRQRSKVRHDLVELLVVAVTGFWRVPTPLPRSSFVLGRRWIGCACIFR